ncbi:hypothetical protein Tco_0356548 [Tanacetum coccineum]
MANIKFADTHNMVAFLAKPAESEGFEQIVDFLNAIVKAKTVNGEVQLQALVDGKKIIITESIVRRDLQLEDAEGVDCLPNATIFEQLTLMGYEKLSQKLTLYKAFFSPQWKFLIHTILQCLSSKTNAWNEFSSTMASAIICLATNQKFNFSKYIFESMVKNLDNADEAVNEEMDDSLVKAATTTTSLDVEQDRGNINKTRSKATLNEPSSPGTSSSSGPKCQETMGDTIAQTRFENVSKYSNDPLLARDYKIPTHQANEIASLKRRVKKLEQKKRSRTHGLKRLYKVGSSRRVESSDEEGLGERDASKPGEDSLILMLNKTLRVNVQTDEDKFGVNDLDGDEVIVESVDVVNTTEETRSVVEEVTAVTIPVSAATTTTITTAITDVEMTLAQALAELKSAKPKANKEQAHTPTVSSQQPSQVKVQDKGKGKMVKLEPVKNMSKKELLRLDEKLAFKLQVEDE